MSIALMTEVWRREARSPAERLLLLAIADYADEKGANIFPSKETLADKADIDVRSVRRICKDLVDRGVLEVVAQTGHSATIYRLNVERLPLKGGGHSVTPDKKSPLTTGQGGDGVMSGGDDNRSPNSSINHQLTKREREARAQDRSMPMPSPAAPVASLDVADFAKAVLTEHAESRGWEAPSSSVAAKHFPALKALHGFLAKVGDLDPVATAIGMIELAQRSDHRADWSSVANLAEELWEQCGRPGDELAEPPVAVTEHTAQVPAGTNLAANALLAGEAFDLQFWPRYEKLRNEGKAKARISFIAVVAGGVEVGRILAGLERYETYCAATGKAAEGFAMRADNWLRGQEFETAWTVPAKRAKLSDEAPKASRFVDPSTVGHSPGELDSLRRDPKRAGRADREEQLRSAVLDAIKAARLRGVKPEVHPAYVRAVKALEAFRRSV